MSEVVTALGISKDVWDALPEEYQQKIKKAIIEGNINLAKQMLAKAISLGKIVVGKGNPTKEKKEFNPLEKTCVDAITSGFFGDRHFDLRNHGAICQRRGLVGREVWDSKKLSLPLRLFAKESRGMEEEQIDELLHNFAGAIDFDENLVKRHFYAIKFNYEDQFLADIEKEEKKRKEIEDLAKEAESEEISIPQEFTEKEIEEEEEE